MVIINRESKENLEMWNWLNEEKERERGQIEKKTEITKRETEN